MKLLKNQPNIKDNVYYLVRRSRGQRYSEYCVAWRESNQWRSLVSGFNIELTNVIEWKEIRDED